MTAPPFLTWLYAPAARPELLRKAMATEADVLIVDLEDSVAEHAKAAARDAMLEFLADVAPVLTPRVHVRVNPVQTDAGKADLVALAGHPRVAGVRLPKIECPEQVALARVLLGGAQAPELYCLIESAAGVEALASIARAVGVAGIALGEADLTAELGLTGEDSLSWLRSRLVVTAVAAGLPPPPMSVYPHLRDDAGLAASCRRGRALGLRGRAAIHPRQLPIIRDCFAPSRAELTQAKDVLDAAARAEAAGQSTFQLLDGRFVDRPGVLAARRTLESAAPTVEDREVS